MTKRSWMLGGLVAIGAVFGSAGANAEIVLANWTFDANGVDGLSDAGSPGLYTTVGVDTWTFNAAFDQDLVDSNNNFRQDVGEIGTVRGVGVITAMFDGDPGSGSIISSPELNQSPGAFGHAGYEVSFDFQVDYKVTAATGVAGPPPTGGFTFEHTAPNLTTGLLNIYVDNLSDGSKCSTGSGANCTNGTLVATFLVQAGGGGSATFTVFDGSDDATFEALFLADGVWFSENGTDLGCSNAVLGHECAGDPLLISDSNFDADPNNDGLLNTNHSTFACTDPRVGVQTAAHNCGTEDGSVILAAIPEPTSLAIFSIGLVMLGGVVGMLRQRPN